MRVVLLLSLLTACAREPKRIPDAGAPLPIVEKPVRIPFEQTEVLPRDEQLFASTLALTAATAAIADKELDALLTKNAPIDERRYFYDLYRFRDRALLPTHSRIANDTRTNPLQRLWSISMLGELGGDRVELRKLASDEDPLVGEYAVTALGRLGEPTTDLLATETNDYVRATIAAPRKPFAITKRVFEPAGRKRLAWFVNFGIKSGEHFERAPNALSTPPVAEAFVFPHQTYRFGIKGAPTLPNFGGQHDHVGEDSGWFLQGLPVHAIGNGVVCKILYDRSWGSLIAIEHRLANDERITSLYAHLHHELNVSPGDIVTMGQKIGEIGPSTTVENGGYWAHLHHGIERSPCETATIAGYDDEVARYADPLWFILERLPSGQADVQKVE